MSDIAISAENVSKRYQLSHLAGQGTLRDTMQHAARLAWRRMRWNTRLKREEFWALRDINFEIKRGEVVGIIGRNGAGKSTLLKILSRITEPTSGRITLQGRVASLLEVGTGFHPELSGRDNIFLNGAILGMSRVEIRRKFDEIVQFAEVERFLDTPVKRYSSGMYVRLAFAVAAHLEPEILIVDEVLAVGDQQFQDKCLGKMRDVAGGGRTVLFVSHNMVATQALCNRAIVMGAGRIEFDGSPTDAVSRYLKQGAVTTGGPREFQGKDPALLIETASFVRENGAEFIDIKLVVRTSEHRRLAVEFILRTTSGVPIAFADCGTLDFTQRVEFNTGETTLAWRIDASTLANGPYLLCTQLVDPFAHVLLRHEHAEPIEVARIPSSSSRRILELDWQAGAVELPLRRLPAPTAK